MKTGNFLRNISPFNNRQDMPMVQYVIKKILAFFLVSDPREFPLPRNTKSAPENRGAFFDVNFRFFIERI